ncbi:hypothetical protein HZS_2252 [Henneguya salminicola]|nr:hypothetical protein HZS_2252 [Henneguya salminicola]
MVQLLLEDLLNQNYYILKNILLYFHRFKAKVPSCPRSIATRNSDESKKQAAFKLLRNIKAGYFKHEYFLPTSSDFLCSQPIHDQKSYSSITNNNIFIKRITAHSFFSPVFHPTTLLLSLLCNLPPSPNCLKILKHDSFEPVLFYLNFLMRTNNAFGNWIKQIGPSQKLLSQSSKESSNSTLNNLKKFVKTANY